MMRPGRRLRALASRVCSARTMERLVDPILADLQCEYDAAVRRGQVWRGRLLLARGYVGFWKAIGWSGLRSACGLGGGDDESRVWRTCVFSIVAFVVVTVLFILPPLLDGALLAGTGVNRALLSLTLVPQALPLSIPAGICIGVLCAMRGRPATRRDLFAVLAIGISCTVMAAAIIEWMVPFANQAFRELVIAQFIPPGRSYHIEPGLNELGFSGLRRRTDPIAVGQFHLMVALCFATIPLSLFALGLARLVKRFAAAVIVALLASIAYPVSMIVLSSLSPRESLSPIVEAWFPNVVLLAAAIASFRLKAEATSPLTGELENR